MASYLIRCVHSATKAVSALVNVLMFYAHIYANSEFICEGQYMLE